MDSERFNQIVEEKTTQIKNLLTSKQKEYAGEKPDVLTNFKQAAKLQHTTPRKALGGMMAKHTISVYDMITSDEKFPVEKWDEKIVDSLNYLILLAGIVEEENGPEEITQEEVDAALSDLREPIKYAAADIAAVGAFARQPSQYYIQGTLISNEYTIRDLDNDDDIVSRGVELYWCNSLVTSLERDPDNGKLVYIGLDSQRLN